MTSALILLVACTHNKDGTGGKSGGEDDSNDTAPVVEEPQPIAVTGWESGTVIAPESGTSQGEPSAVALPDGVILASWMQTMDDGYSLYVVMSRSEDGGLTWSEPETVDEDRWGWQNDPTFIYANGRVIFTWLPVEDSRGSTTRLYCIDSTDGGKTWSDKVLLSTESDSVDRQWLATDGTDHVVITWDSFQGSYSEDLVFSETTSGCAGFSEPEVITNGIFLNGIPAIDTDGNIWVSRNNFSRRDVSYVISKKTDSGWEDLTLQRYDYPSGSSFVRLSEHEEEEGEHHIDPDEGLEHHSGVLPIDVNLTRRRFQLAHGLIDGPSPEFPTAAATGTFDGSYSPVLAASPLGGLVVATLATDAADDEFADVSFFRVLDGEVTNELVLNQDEGGLPQMEPWITVDEAGGIHAIWYDGREDAWRLYSAHSVDDGATWTEHAAGANTFTKGFNESTRADYYAWVGHFQSLVISEGEVVAVFGDSSDGNHSRIHAARTQSE